MIWLAFVWTVGSVIARMEAVYDKWLSVLLCFALFRLGESSWWISNAIEVMFPRIGNSGSAVFLSFHWIYGLAPTIPVDLAELASYKQACILHVHMVSCHHLHFVIVKYKSAIMEGEVSRILVFYILLLDVLQ